MKKKSFVVFSLVFAMLFSLCLSACGKNYTDDENFADWFTGITYSYEYSGDYTFSFTGEQYIDNVLVANATELEVLSGNKYYYDYVENSIAVSQVKQEYKDSRVIKQIVVDGETKTKYVREASLEGKVERNGYYVSPTHALKLVEYSPAEVIEMFSLNEEYSTYQELQEAMAQLIEHYYGEASLSTEMSIKRNSDGSVSVVLDYSYNSPSEDLAEEDADYTNSVTFEHNEYIVKDGKLIKTNSISRNEDYYQDSTKNRITKEIQNSTLDYAFDENHYNSLSTNTESTINMFYGKVSFDVYGYTLITNDGNFLVGDTYENANAKECLNDSYSFIIYNGDYSDMYELYTDAEFTQPFTSLTVEEYVTFYVKLVIPDNCAMVVSVDTNHYSGEKVKLIHVVELGKEYTFDTYLADYEAISIDGESAEGKTGFVCEEQKVYIVKCKSNYS